MPIPLEQQLFTDPTTRRPTALMHGILPLILPWPVNSSTPFRHRSATTMRWSCQTGMAGFAQSSCRTEGKWLHGQGQVRWCESGCHVPGPLAHMAI